MADNYSAKLRKLADTLDEARRELNLAREQSTKLNHLVIRAGRAVIQASRVVVAAVDLGCLEIWPPGQWILSSMRNPNDPNRQLLKIQKGDWEAEVGAIKLGSGCNQDGTLPDDTALEIWIHQICPVMHNRQTTAKGNAGTFDFPKVKTDDDGRIVGRDGEPLQIVEHTDPETGERTGMHLQGTAAQVTDDYDETDALEHLRCQVADWIDVCDLTADLIREEAANAERRIKSEDSAYELTAAETSSGKCDVAHSDDFRSVLWFGEQYTFTTIQAACVKILWRHWQQRTPVIGEAELLRESGSAGDRLRDVFDKGKHRAWKTMITSPNKGAFCLAKPDKS